MHAAATSATQPASDDEDESSLAGLERIGETHAWGEALLRLLTFYGWTIDQRPGFAGHGVTVTALRHGTTLISHGDTVAAAVAPIFETAMRSPAGR